MVLTVDGELCIFSFEHGGAQHHHLGASSERGQHGRVGEVEGTAEGAGQTEGQEVPGLQGICRTGMCTARSRWLLSHFSRCFVGFAVIV